jgi:hypothetical protein
MKIDFSELDDRERLEDAAQHYEEYGYVPAHPCRHHRRR